MGRPDGSIDRSGPPRRSGAPSWRILQLADSAFPTGGFAHSAGLEAAVACGLVPDAAALEAHVRAHLWNVGHAALPFVAAAHDRPGAFEEIDAELDAFLTNHVANRASRTQGRAFLATCARVFDAADLERLTALARRGGTPAHLAAASGAALAAVGIAREDALALHLFAALRGVLSAAVRLGVAGPHEAARVQRAQDATLDAILAATSALTPAGASTVAPLLDIAGATHDRLYTRLFQS